MKRTASALTCIIALSFSAWLLSPVVANWFLPPLPGMPSIIINPNGGTSYGPIIKAGNVYTLVGNITNHNLKIQCSNITVDGAGYTLQGDALFAPNSEIVIEADGVTVKNMNVRQYGNVECGISIAGSNNTVINATITCVGGGNYGFTGIRVTGFNNTVAENNVDWGILVCGNYTDIRRNEIFSMGLSLQNSMEPSNFTTVVENTIHGDFAVHLSTGPSVFYLNNFVDITTEAVDPFPFTYGSPQLRANCTFFGNGNVGNYWSDYNGTDADGDGIGDTPYVIGGNLQDDHPLMARFDNSSGTTLLPRVTQPSQTPSGSPSAFGPAWLVYSVATVSLAFVAVAAVAALVYLKNRKFHKK